MAIIFSSSRRPKAGQIQSLYAHAPWASQRSAAQIRVMLRHTPLFFTAWKQGALVGMARATTDFAFRAVLWDVIVDPAFARRGIGSRLVRAFLKHPRLRKVESFWLSTTDKQRFYARFGFRLRPRNIMVYKKAPR